MLKLRSRDASVTEIANTLSGEGSPVSAQMVWSILHAEGIERLERRGPGGPAPRTDPVKARALSEWPVGSVWPCDHSGLYLLLPAMAELGLDALPLTKLLSSRCSAAHASEPPRRPRLGCRSGSSCLPGAGRPARVPRPCTNRGNRAA